MLALRWTASLPRGPSRSLGHGLEVMNMKEQKIENNVNDLYIWSLFLFNCILDEDLEHWKVSKHAFWSWPKHSMFDPRWYEEADCIGLEIRHRSIEVRAIVTWSASQVHNNECGLPCFGTKTESKPLPELHPKCLKMKQERGAPFYSWVYMIYNWFLIDLDVFNLVFNLVFNQDCIFSTWSQWSVCQNQVSLAPESYTSLEVDQAVRSRQIDKESLNGGVACSLTTVKELQHQRQ